MIQYRLHSPRIIASRGPTTAGPITVICMSTFIASTIYNILSTAVRTCTCSYTRKIPQVNTHVHYNNTYAARQPRAPPLEHTSLSRSRLGTDVSQLAALHPSPQNRHPRSLTSPSTPSLRFVLTPLETSFIRLRRQSSLPPRPSSILFSIRLPRLPASPSSSQPPSLPPPSTLYHHCLSLPLTCNIIRLSLHPVPLDHLHCLLSPTSIPHCLHPSLRRPCARPSCLRSCYWRLSVPLPRRLLSFHVIHRKLKQTIMSSVNASSFLQDYVLVVHFSLSTAMVLLRIVLAFMIPNPLNVIPLCRNIPLPIHVTKYVFLPSNLLSRMVTPMPE